MSGHSVLFNEPNNLSYRENIDAPEFFADLNLDQVIDIIIARKDEYNLRPFYYSPLSEVDAILYRQEVFQDLEDNTLAARIKSFAEKMELVRRYINLANKLYYKYHQEGWFLEAVIVYCDAVSSLAKDLKRCSIKSRGLSDFREYLRNYATSASFAALKLESKQVKEKLEAIQYSIIIKGNWVRVRKYEAEIDYSVEVERTFEKFKQGEVKNYKVDRPVPSGMNHVEAQILHCVARLYPEIFEELVSFVQKYNNFFDEIIRDFDRQIQFYISYLDFIGNIKELKELEFCYPEVTMQEKRVFANETFDIALANKNLYNQSPVICNDFFLEGKERIIIISGPNQGGKTTFARMFSQLHYLACLGCPIPGASAQLFLYDRLFTHFEREEDIKNLRGKLKDDLVRIHNILDQATPNSIIIMNEIFT